MKNLHPIINVLGLLLIAPFMMAYDKIVVPVLPPKPIRAPVVPTRVEGDRTKRHPRQDKHKEQLA